MRVVITGATGFVGQTLLKQLQQQQTFQLLVIGRNNPDELPGFINIETQDSSQLAQSLRGVDCLVHLAALAHTRNTTSADYERSNVELTEKLATAAVDANIRQFIYISSIKVLGNKSAVGKPFTSRDLPAPEDHYGKSKLKSENILQHILLNSGTAWTIVRPPLVWGSNAKGNLKTLIGLINRRIPIPFGAIHNRRDVISLNNLTDFIAHILLNPNAFNEIFLVSDNKTRSTLDIIYTLEEFTNKKAKIIYCPLFFFKLLAFIPGLKPKIESFTGDLEVDISDTLHRLSWKPRP